MNSKIRELAAQARQEFNEHYEYCRLNEQHWEWDFEQRFAELIVKECGQFMDVTTRRFMMKHLGVSNEG